MNGEPYGKCQAYYCSRGHTPERWNRCRRRAIAVIVGKSVCAMHAPRLVKLWEARERRETP